MEPVLVHVDERLRGAGDTLPLAGHIDQASYQLGDHEFALPDGIDYDLILTNAGEGILATGILRARALGTCDRCLEEAELDISGEVDGYYLFEEPEQLSDDEDEVDFYLVGEEDMIDLAPALNDALIMETPFVVLCRPDCKGLCPHCGANLNEGPCDCAERVREEELSNSPFAALAGLKLDDSDEE